jgi:hypothetical protein
MSNVTYKVSKNRRSHVTLRLKIGASGVHALPLAAGINIGGHYKWHFFLFSITSLNRTITSLNRNFLPAHW